MPSGYVWPLSKRREVFGAVIAGMGVKRAGLAHGVATATVDAWWVNAGGMNLLAVGRRGALAVPVDAERPGGRGHRLSLQERISIQHGRDLGWSLSRIGAQIGRDKSVISRELARHRGPDGIYHAGVAAARAARAARRPKQFKLADEQLCAKIAGWMDQGWSPGLIAQVLGADHPDDRSRRVSHETIYQALYVQSRGALRADLAKRLSTGRTKRKARGRVERRGAPYSQALRISQRPPSVADRAVPGHWEGDLIVGPASRSAIGTLVERSSRFVILLHLPGRHTAEEVAAAMITEMSKLPGHLRRSLTWDRGTELADYNRIQLDLQMPVYFADPHSPWQRGSNENSNRLLRFWFTKGSDLSTWTAPEIRTVQDTLNKRPRPTLGLRTPAQVLNQYLIDQAS